MKKLYGVTTAMTTPMHENGDINTGATEQLTNFLIEKGVDCLYPLGTTGEMLKLSLTERKEIAETVIRTANKRVNTFIHVGAMNTEDTLELAQHAYDCGADGIGIVTPIFFSANDKEIEQFYATIAEAMPNDFPIYLYSIPQLTGNELSIAVVNRLADKYKNIIGIKYSYPDFQMLKEYVKVRSGAFSVLTGADALFVPALAMGCDGVVSGVSGVYPEPFVSIYQSFADHNLAQARTYQLQADDIITILKAGANMSYFKQALNDRGIPAGSVKAPQQDIDAAEKEALLHSIAQWKQQHNI